MRIVVEDLRYAQITAPFIGTFDPYEHQLKTLELVREAVQKSQTICIENTSVTGSGKTLANFAAAALDGVRSIGIYPTNELMLDQHVSLKDTFSSQDILILDSQGLDGIVQAQPHMRSHAQALAWATGDLVPNVVLTNPDVLYLAMYDLYGQMFSTFHRSAGERIFQHVLSNYPVIAFDEFHLYSTKQIANAAFIMGTAQKLVPEKPHIFIFSSATPQEQFRHYLQRLGLQAQSVTNARAESGQVVCEPVEINVFPANLLQWQGGEEIRARLHDILAWADSCSPHARGVFIVDSVYEAKCIADVLRTQYPTEVGEVHGYINEEERAKALRLRLSVGTTTIDVGVDLTGNKSKEFLVCEARSAAQAIQRIGRLGRRRREPQNIAIPNRVWLAVPDYVYHYLTHHVSDGTSMSRGQLSHILNEAYLGHETFDKYTIKYSPLEAVAACERIQRQYFEDRKTEAIERLHQLVVDLYNNKPLVDHVEVEQSYKKYLNRQLAVWHKFGTAIQSNAKTAKGKSYYLSDLESFRGGMESDFTVAIYDELDRQLGINPIKTYTLPFVLRRTQCEEISREQFVAMVKENHPKQAEQWLAALQSPREPLGYLHVFDLVRGKANNVYFEASKADIDGRLQEVIRLEGLTIEGEHAHLSTRKGGINDFLKQRKLNCWISERKSFPLSQSLSLPPLFAIYPLHARHIGGTYSDWSIAFGLDAFLLESISRRKRWAGVRTNTGAFIC
jgi:CRISPR-associated helicase Cas3